MLKHICCIGYVDFLSARLYDGFMRLTVIRKACSSLEKRLPKYQLLILLSVIIGLVMGVAAIVLKTLVHYIEDFLRMTQGISNINMLFIIFPLGGIFLTLVFIRLFVKDDLSHGVSKVLRAIAVSKGDMPIHSTYSYITACSLTAGFGGSVGMEAPILATGGAVGSNLGKLFNFTYKQRIVLIGCGAAAAVAAIFKAPIAGLIIALELLMIDSTVAAIIPILISSVTGAILSMLISEQTIEFSFAIRDPFNFRNIPFYILLGIVSGFVSLYFTRTVSFMEEKAKVFKSKILRAAVFGIILGILVFALPPLFGEGYSTMKAMLSGKQHEVLNNSFFFAVNDKGWLFVVFLLLVMLGKAIACSLTTSAGGIGGIFAPSLFMGCITGFIFARSINLLGWIHITEKNFALVGMAGVLSGVMHTPLTAIFLIAEITGGYDLFIPLIITSMLSFLTIKQFERYSLYTKHLAASGELITHQKDVAVLKSLELEKFIDRDATVVHPETKLEELTNLIASSRKSVFPVVGNANEFLGFINLDDVREIMFKSETYNLIIAFDIMIQPQATIQIHDTMETVMEKFQKSSFSYLPVLNGKTYTGIVSRIDILNQYRKTLIELSSDEL